MRSYRRTFRAPPCPREHRSYSGQPKSLVEKDGRCRFACMSRSGAPDTRRSCVGFLVQPTPAASALFTDAAGRRVHLPDTHHADTASRAQRRGSRLYLWRRTSSAGWSGCLARRQSRRAGRGRLSFTFARTAPRKASPRRRATTGPILSSTPARLRPNGRPSPMPCSSKAASPTLWFMTASIGCNRFSCRWGQIFGVTDRADELQLFFRIRHNETARTTADPAGR